MASVARHAAGTTEATGCTVLHVDMDAFFACVAIRDRPELRGRAGHRRRRQPGRGAVGDLRRPRAYGVHSAMPMTRARRMCPHAVVVPPDYDESSAVSSAVMETFRSVTPLVEPLSMDEAFLDVSGCAAAVPVRRSRSASTCGPGSPTSSGSPARSGSPPTTQLAKLASPARQARRAGRRHPATR